MEKGIEHLQDKEANRKIDPAWVFLAKHFAPGKWTIGGAIRSETRNKSRCGCCPVLKLLPEFPPQKCFFCKDDAFIV